MTAVASSACVLGVDGGASSTRAVVADLDGNLLAFARAGPSNHAGGEAGRRRLRSALEGSVGAALASIESRGLAACLEGLRAATLGMTAVNPGTPEAERVREALLALLPSRALDAGLRGRIEVVSDVRIALEGATEGRPGILVYAGTGSVAMGRDASGTLARAGGWGPLIDDKGGGYDVGRQALRAVLRAHDGRGPATALTRLILEHFGVDGPGELVQRVYAGEGLDRAGVAALSRLVARAAGAGDEVALAILRGAARELARLAETVARRLGMVSPVVHWAGGLFRIGAPLIRPFTEAVRARLPGARVRAARSTPLAGALLMAYGQLGHPVGTVVAARLRARLERVERAP